MLQDLLLRIETVLVHGAKNFLHACHLTPEDRVYRRARHIIERAGDVTQQTAPKGSLVSRVNSSIQIADKMRSDYDLHIPADGRWTLQAVKIARDYFLKQAKTARRVINDTGSRDSNVRIFRELISAEEMLELRAGEHFDAMVRRMNTRQYESSTADLDLQSLLPRYFHRKLEPQRNDRRQFFYIHLTY